MNINIGSDKNYYSQRNDATFFLLKSYEAKFKAVACGPNMILCGMEMNGWLTKEYDHIWGKGMQKTDAYMMMLYNPANEHILESIRPSTLEYPRQEVPQYLTLINHIYGEDIVHFAWGLTLDLIEEHLKNHQPVGVCGNFPGVGGHYVLIHGMTDSHLIYSDSYNIKHGENYFNQEMDFEFFEKYIDRNFRLFLDNNNK